MSENIQPAPSQPSKTMERFPNPCPERPYEIAFDCPEFTCLCPLTGQPDFANIEIKYHPAEYCVELKVSKCTCGPTETRVLSMKLSQLYL